jgi:hypothetical protein
LVAAAIWSWWVYRLPQSDFWAEVVVTAHVGALSQNFVPPAGPLRITAQMGPLVLPLELVKQPDGISEYPSTRNPNYTFVYTDKTPRVYGLESVKTVDELIDQTLTTKIPVYAFKFTEGAPLVSYRLYVHIGQTSIVGLADDGGNVKVIMTEEMLHGPPKPLEKRPLGIAIFERAAVILRDTESFLDGHNGTLTAVATIAVALFTYVLARVTGRQARLTRQLAESTEIAARAAQDSASALPVLERAYVFIETEPNSLRDIPMRFQRKDPEGADLAAARPSTIGFNVANQGKTPAIIKATSFTLQYRADIDHPLLLQPEPLRAGPAAIPAGAVSTPSFAPAEHVPNGVFNLAASLAQPLTADEIERLRAGACVLLFVGRVIYDDVFGNEHEVRVCRRYDPNTRELVEHGGAEFNHRT